MDIFDFNLRHLHLLALTVRHSSISRAAADANLSQPAATQALRKIETQIGAQLFERRVDRIAPLESARVLASRIETALDHIASTRVTMVQLRALIGLDDHGSYVAAGQALGLAQPSIHRAIRDLSFALRRELVVRRGHGVALSDAGRRTVRAFRLAHRELEAGLAELANLTGAETGAMRIGVMPLARAQLLPAAIAEFHRRKPQVFFEVLEGAFADLVEPLRDGKLDLMLGALRPHESQPDLAQAPLFVDRPVVIARAGHPLARARAPRAKLIDYPWILPPPGTPLRLLWDRMLDGLGLAAPPVPIACGSVLTIRQILRETDFLTLLSPSQVQAELEVGWLTIAYDPPIDLTRIIGLTMRKDWRPPQTQLAFIDLLRDVVLKLELRQNG